MIVEREMLKDSLCRGLNEALTQKWFDDNLFINMRIKMLIEAIEERAFESHRTRNKKSKSKKDERREKYLEYLSSSKWKAFRQQILQERGGKCESCGNIAKPFHIHHKHYQNLYNEQREDVLLLCVSCHKNIHNKHHGNKMRKRLEKAEKKRLAK